MAQSIHNSYSEAAMNIGWHCGQRNHFATNLMNASRDICSTDIPCNPVGGGAHNRYDPSQHSLLTVDDALSIRMAADAPSIRD
ncbi:MAG TPA: hypothetical protein VGG85_03875 [Terracidiphilus sp.]